MSLLVTLPPRMGKKYFFQLEGETEQHECTIMEADEDYDGKGIFWGKSPTGPNLWYRRNGKAMGGDNRVLARLVGDAPESLVDLKPSPEFLRLKDGHERMLARVKELEA